MLSGNKKGILGLGQRLLLALALGLASALTACSPGPPHIVLGVYEPDDPGSYSQVSAFAAEVGQQPGIVSYYSNWGLPFQTAFAATVWAHHRGETLVQIDPRNVALTAIAAGQHDAYLHAYAASVRSFGRQVILSFGQEMNGNWYPWGSGHAAPADFVAAWRHIVSLFRAQGVRNVTWLWDVNCSYPGGPPISKWWPGGAYVNWVGIDCYYAYQGDTFSDMFDSTIDAARRLTSDPVLIGETAIAPVAGPGKVADLFSGVQQNHLLGLLWFDEAQHQDAYHQDWRLEDDPAMLAAFRAAARSVTG